MAAARTPTASGKARRPPARRPAKKSSAASRARDPRVDLLAGRLDSLTSQVEELGALLKAQNEFIAHLKNSRPAARIDTPKARATEADSKGISPDAEYDAMVVRFRALVRSATAPGSTVAVISKGDAGLVSLEGRNGWHFPRDHRGVYRGHHPADGREAVGHLEELRAAGAGYLAVPSTSFWWFEHYPEFNQHLVSRFTQIIGQEDTCRLFELSGAAV